MTLPAHIEDEFTALELLLDENGYRHLTRVRAFMLQALMERDQANERTRNVTEALLRAEENRWTAH